MNSSVSSEHRSKKFEHLAKKGQILRCSSPLWFTMFPPFLGYFELKFCYHLLQKALRVFSRDVTLAMLTSLNKGTAAILVSSTNPPGIELSSYANAFFCFGWKTFSLIFWVKTLCVLICSPMILLFQTLLRSKECKGHFETCGVNQCLAVCNHTFLSHTKNFVI